MAVADLTDRERAIIGECLVAAVEGPFFPEVEFATLFGLPRREVAAIAAAWPELEDSNDDAHLAINGALNNLLGYPHGLQSEWARHISVTEDELTRVFEKSGRVSEMRRSISNKMSLVIGRFMG